MRIRTDTVSIDWYQGTQPESCTRTLQHTITRVTREHPKHAAGRRHPSGFSYPEGLYWLNGSIQLHHSGNIPTPTHASQMDDYESRRSWLIVQGSACSQLGFSGVHAIAHRSLIGGTCKRIDIRRDLRGEGLSLVDDVISSCEAGHLRHARQYQTFPIRSVTGELIGNGCYLGSGKSERFVRCYDKGLEQGSDPAGSWHRYECQLSDDHAHEAAVSILRHSSEDLALREALTILLGVADFRIGPRGSGIRLHCLPRPSWWERFVGDLEPVRPSLPHRDPDIARYSQHLAHQLSACIGAARRLSCSLADVLEAIAVEDQYSPPTVENPLVDLIFEFMTRPRSGRHPERSEGSQRVQAVPAVSRARFN